MKKIFGAAAVLALLAAGPTTSFAAGPCDFGNFMDFDADAFAYETTYNPVSYHSTNGSTLKMVGHITLFCPPLAALNPADPNKEYTFVVTATSTGTIHYGPFAGFFYHETDYTGGTWAVYEGSPEDAPTAASMPALPSPLVPATFQNGTVVLSGTLGTMHTSISTDGTQANTNGSFLANYQATGGSYYNAVGNGSAVFQGLWCVWPKPAGCRPATYSAHTNGKWDIPPTTSTSKSTWGALKKLYK